jgi:hypothetical protein
MASKAEKRAAAAAKKAAKLAAKQHAQQVKLDAKGKVQDSAFWLAQVNPPVEQKSIAKRLDDGVKNHWLLVAAGAAVVVGLILWHRHA